MTEEIEKTEAMEETAATEQKAEEIKNLDLREALVDEIKLDWLIDYPTFAQQLHAMVNDPAFIQLRRKQDEANIFSIVGQTNTERWHSSFLAWLLNPEGSHGLNYFPLKNLLMFMYKEATEKQRNDLNLPDPYVLDAGIFCNSQVQPTNKGKLKLPEVTVNYTFEKGGKKYEEEKCSFDIALSADITFPSIETEQKRRFIFICENKVDSPEGKKTAAKFPQTKIYADFWVKEEKEKRTNTTAFFPLDSTNNFYSKGVKSHLALLFLSARGDTAHDKRFISMTYTELYESILLPALKHPDLSTSGRYLLEEYIKVLDVEGYIVSNVTKGFLKNIFDRHLETFKSYLRYRFFFELPEDITEKADKLKALCWLNQFAGMKHFVVRQKSVGINCRTITHVDFRNNDWKYTPARTDVFNCPIGIIKAHYDTYIDQWKNKKNEDPIDLFSEFWKSEILDKRDSDIKKYINAFDSRYEDTLSFIMDGFVKLMERDKDYNLFCGVIPVLSKNSTNYGYLRFCKHLTQNENDKELYSGLYFKDDSEFQHCISINLKDPMRPVFHYEEKTEMSGYQICNIIADKLDKGKTEDRNYTWVQYLGVKIEEKVGACHRPEWTKIASLSKSDFENKKEKKSKQKMVDKNDCPCNEIKEQE